MMLNRNSAVGLSLALLLACVAPSSVRAAVSVEGRDKTVKVTLPDGWKEDEIPADFDPNVQLMAIHGKDDLGMMAIIVDRSDNTDTLQQYVDGIRKNYTDSLQDVVFTDPTKVKVKGKPALRFDMHCTVKQVKLAYLITVIQTDARFEQVTSWCVASKLEKVRTRLASLSDDLEDLKAPAGAAAKPKSTEPLVIKGKSGVAEMTYPAGWKQIQKLPNDQADLFASNGKQTEFSIVIAESHEDLTTSFKEYGKTVIDQMIDKGTNGKATEFEPVKYHGMDAMQCDLDLTFNNVKVTYVVTVLKTEKHFFQVLSWSLASDFKKYEPDLKKLPEGLKELEEPK